MKKIIKSKAVSDYEVLTDTGWSDIKNVHTTIEYEIYIIKTANGFSLKCADNHIIFDKDMTEIFVKDLKLNQLIQTKNGTSKVVSIFKTGEKETMYDLEVDDINHRYFTGGILSHNTSVIEGLAVRIYNNNVPISLQRKRIYTLELSTLVAGTKYRGQFEERIKAILDEIKSNDNLIVFIDELHTLVGAGGSSGSLDAANIFKPALARGDIHCIGATTFDEFRENIEGDAALSRRFQKVVVEPSTKEETVEILMNVKDRYEEHHLVTYNKEIINDIVELADRYITDRFFPDKAFDILDEVGSYRNIIGSTIPDHILKLSESLEDIKEEKLDAVKIQDYELAARCRDKYDAVNTALESEMKLWKENLKKNKHAVTEDDLLHVVSKLSGIPLNKITERENKELLNLKESLSSVVIGQDEAIEKVSTVIQRNRVGIRKKNRTIGNFIFLGTTGIGKTFLAKNIAKSVFGSEDSLIRIDMSEYRERFNVSKLIGSPPGYIGHGEGGFLTEQVKNRPHSLVLFDEIEKAHPEVFNILLQMLDDGYLVDSMGRKIDFRNCLIIMTSNQGTHNLEKFGTGVGFKTSKTIAEQSQLEKDALMKSLKTKFTPEFLNRIDEIVLFNKLTRDGVMSILENEIKDLRSNLKEVGNYTLSIDKKAKEFILSQGYDEKYGARQLIRTIEKLIENPISELILKKEIQEGDKIIIKGLTNKLKIKGKTNK